MKLCCIMLLWLLATSLYFSCTSIVHSSSSFSSSKLLTERPFVRWKGRKLEVVDEGWKKLDSGASISNDNETGEDGDELVYHVDYHGVSTHPTPTPKHPRP